MEGFVDGGSDKSETVVESDVAEGVVVVEGVVAESGAAANIGEDVVGVGTGKVCLSGFGVVESNMLRV